MIPRSRRCATPAERGHDDVPLLDGEDEADEPARAEHDPVPDVVNPPHPTAGRSRSRSAASAGPSPRAPMVSVAGGTESSQSSIAASSRVQGVISDIKEVVDCITEATAMAYVNTCSDSFSFRPKIGVSAFIPSSFHLATSMILTGWILCQSFVRT